MSIYVFIFITAAMQVPCPGFVQPTTLLSLDAAYCLFREIQRVAAVMALQRHSTAYHMPPTSFPSGKPTALRETPPLTWQDSWTRLQQALHAHGLTHMQAALDSLDPITQKCVAFIGPENLHLLIDSAETRAYYARVFRAFQRRSEMSRLPYSPARDAGLHSDLDS